MVTIETDNIEAIWRDAKNEAKFILRQAASAGKAILKIDGIIAKIVAALSAAKISIAVFFAYLTGRIEFEDVLPL
jgi:hypothetical protein